jgi:hypothetical protein
MFSAKHLIATMRLCCSCQLAGKPAAGSVRLDVSSIARSRPFLTNISKNTTLLLRRSGQPRAGCCRSPLDNEYLESPLRAKFHQAIVQSDVLLSGLNLSEIPLAARKRTGRAAAVALYGAWIGLLLILGVVALLLRWVYRLSRWRNKEHPFLETLAQLTLPASILVLTPIVFYLTRVQLKLVGSVAVGTEVVGTIEAIGIRSTRIRGIDHTLTTIPNGVLSKMPVVNFTRRDRMLLKTVLSLRYETTPEQLCHVVAKLRELLLAHPMVTPEPSRVRFAGFDKSSLNVEVFAYIGTKDWNEFLEVQEDIYLRMIDVIAASGTGFAFPSQTLYFARDKGLDPDKSAAAMAEVQQWRAAQKLPFPDFDIEFRKTHRDTLDYPPNGSSTAESKKQG